MKLSSRHDEPSFLEKRSHRLILKLYFLKRNCHCGRLNDHFFKMDTCISGRIFKHLLNVDLLLFVF